MQDTVNDFCAQELWAETKPVTRGKILSVVCKFFLNKTGNSQHGMPALGTIGNNHLRLRLTIVCRLHSWLYNNIGRPKTLKLSISIQIKRGSRGVPVLAQWE